MIKWNFEKPPCRATRDNDLLWAAGGQFGWFIGQAIYWNTLSNIRQRIATTVALCDHLPNIINWLCAIDFNPEDIEKLNHCLNLAWHTRENPNLHHARGERRVLLEKCRCANTVHDPLSINAAFGRAITPGGKNRTYWTRRAIHEVLLFELKRRKALTPKKRPRMQIQMQTLVDEWWESTKNTLAWRTALTDHIC